MTCTTLNSGAVVVAHNDRDYWPKQYVNRTSATRAAAQLVAEGWRADVIQRGRPWYVRIAGTVAQ